MNSNRVAGPNSVAILGGGPAGALLATLLAEDGADVVLYESRADLRRGTVDGGRSINLTLAKRGIVALQDIGVMDDVDRIAMPLAGRMVHADGASLLHRYGRRADDVIHSISRNGLNGIMLDRAERTGRVRFEFGHRLLSVDFDDRRLEFAVSDGHGSGSTSTREVHYELLFGADGSNSAVRSAMVEAGHTTVDIQPLDHGYKELRLHADPAGAHRLEPNALHVWPRREFVLLAFANPDGSFTVTLFMPEAGSRPVSRR